MPALAELVRDHARYERAGELRADLPEALLRSLFAPSPRLHVLVVAKGDELIGYASWSLEVSTWRAAEYAHLDCLYLTDTARGQGIGRDLMRAVEVAASHAGVSELQWQTPAWNEPAIRFYRRGHAQETPKVRFTSPLVHRNR